MSENTNIARRLIEDVWNKRDLTLVNQFVSSDFRNIDPSTPDLGTGPDAYNKLFTRYTTAFPDLRFTINDVIDGGDKVVLRWTVVGTHKGELNGIAPTGKSFSITGTTTSNFSNGKISESYVNWDALGMLQQLGVVAKTEKIGRAA